MCDHCGRAPRKNFPAALPKVSYTREFAKRTMSLLTAREMHTTADIVDAVVNQNLSHVTGVYLDEIQFGSGQDCISVFADHRCMRARPPPRDTTPA